MSSSLGCDAHQPYKNMSSAALSTGVPTAEHCGKVSVFCFRAAASDLVANGWQPGVDLPWKSSPVSSQNVKQHVAHRNPSFRRLWPGAGAVFLNSSKRRCRSGPSILRVERNLTHNITQCHTYVRCTLAKIEIVSPWFHGIRRDQC